MRFRVGEIAIFKVARFPVAIPMVGTQVEILMVGPFKEGISYEWFNGKNITTPRIGDYVIGCPWNNNGALVMDWQLAKLNPPEEPLYLSKMKEEEVQ